MFVGFFCCAGSGTSQEYAKMVKKELGKDDPRVYVDYIKNVVKKFNNGELENYDIVLAHGQGISVNQAYFEQNKFKEMVNAVYMMPQAGPNLFCFKQNLDPYNIPCRVLTPKECTDVLLNLKNIRIVFKDIADKYEEVLSNRVTQL